MFYNNDYRCFVGSFICLMGENEKIDKILFAESSVYSVDKKHKSGFGSVCVFIFVFFFNFFGRIEKYRITFRFEAAG